MLLGSFVVMHILILAASVWPAPGQTVPVEGADKLVHAAEFAVLAWLGYRVLLRRRLAVGAVHAAVAVFVYVAFWGALTEVIQLWAPGRSCSFGDWAADIVGAALALGAAWILTHRRTV
ncbi:MAG: VanZ family protein [Candidatus Omnitrophica bacterium]|nr:VanZ family protein [Candidatus Omnitrophota bacterium]